jgi:hypothetical protein
LVVVKSKEVAESFCEFSKFFEDLRGRERERERPKSYYNRKI